MKKLIIYSIILFSGVILIYTILGSKFLLGKNEDSTDKKKIAALEMPFEFFTLKNGLQVILQPDAKQSKVSVKFWLKSGSKNETNNQYGLAHFFEHVTPYGLKGKDKKLQLLNSAITDGNAQTKKDYTRYFLEVKPNGLEVALQYTSDRIKSKSSAITKEKVEQERTRVLNEIEHNSDNAFWSEKGSFAIESATFGQSHPYGHGVYGLIENNKHFSLKDFQDWFDKTVYPNNILLFVVGNIDAIKTKKRIKKYFENIPNTKSKHVELKIPKPKQASIKLIENTNAKDNYQIFVWNIPQWGAKEDPSFKILANILDKRLQKTVKLHPILSGANASDLLNLYQYAGQFGVYVSFSSIKDSLKAKKILKKEIDNLITNGITEKELEQAKKQEMEKYLGFEYSRTALLGESLLFKNNAGWYFLLLKQALNLKKEAIEKVAKIWLKPNPSSITFVSKTNN